MLHSTHGSVAPRDPRAPSPDQPGTLGQQFLAIAYYLSEPLRHLNPATAWEFLATLKRRAARSRFVALDAPARRGPRDEN